MENFTPIRRGILDHLRGGKMCPFDLGVYVALHLRADWSTGVYRGCALALAYDFGDSNLRDHIKKSLFRLRERGFINYPKGDGMRGSYDILINKRDVTSGERAGMRLDAWKHGKLAKPEYAPQNGNGAVKPESPKPKTEPVPIVPDWMPAESWQGFCEMRQRMRAPLTPRAVTLIIKKLAELRARGDDPAMVLDRSVQNGWRGLFPLKNERKNGHGTNGAKSKGERIEDSVSSAVREANRIAEQRRGQRETAPQ
jgi:hypothetical protein